eukprot:3501386-Amphidinium_carterae.1
MVVCLHRTISGRLARLRFEDLNMAVRLRVMAGIGLSSKPKGCEVINHNRQLEDTSKYQTPDHKI